MAQGLANQGYVDAAALSEAGAAQESYAQQLLNAKIDRWNHDQQKEIAALNAYNQIIQGDYGSVHTTSTKEESGSKLGGFFSGAATGASAGASIGGPWGALIGGVGGGILGLL
jgi:hypothetical protein